MRRVAYDQKAMSKTPPEPVRTPIIIDTREPWPHPWARHLPEAVFIREGLATGDIALAGNSAIVVERKTISDFLGTITAGRDRFERELARARELHQFHIIVEGSLGDVMAERGGMTAASLLGTVAALTRRGSPIHFADTEKMAAQLAYAILTQPWNEANKLASRVGRAAKKAGKLADPGMITGNPVHDMLMQQAESATETTTEPENHECDY